MGRPVLNMLLNVPDQTNDSLMQYDIYVAMIKAGAIVYRSDNIGIVPRGSVVQMALEFEIMKEIVLVNPLDIESFLEQARASGKMFINAKELYRAEREKWLSLTPEQRVKFPIEERP